MRSWPKHPLIYEINTWAWLHDLSTAAGRSLSLADVAHSELDRIASLGFDGVWLMGVWQRSRRGREIAASLPDLRAEYTRALSDFREDDVVGSPYAIANYEVDDALGGREALRALRDRLRSLNLRVILDFVPNHLAVDHPWLSEFPERFVQGTPRKRASEPKNYFSHGVSGTSKVFAHGRDPNYDGWTDTAQLDYRRRDTRRAMEELLLSIAPQCDGVRCDMAMLVLDDVFVRTWGGEFDPPNADFWGEAIKAVKARYPSFLMLGEVYWDLEHRLQQLGFDYAYDKRLYDRLLHDDAEAVRAHLRADCQFQRRLTRFVENHDERRAAEAFGRRGPAAAALALTLPGMRLVHEGELEGRCVKLPVQLGRRPSEPPQPGIQSHYNRLLRALADPVFHEGTWRLLHPQPVGTSPSHRAFLAHSWSSEDAQRLVVVNLSSAQAQCYLPLDLPSLAGNSWQLRDRLGPAEYTRPGDELLNPGLYLDVPPYGFHLFEFQPRVEKPAPGLRHRCTFSGHHGPVYGMAWSPDGRMLASAGQERTVVVWNVEDCSPAGELRGHDDVIGSLAWSPDARLLASGSDDRTIRLWKPDDGQPLAVLRHHQGNVLALAWSGSGDLLASGSTDRRAIVCHRDGGRIVQEFGEHTEAVNAVAWSPDARTLATGSGDQTVQLWDVGSRRRIHLLNAGDWVSSLAWSGDGKYVVAGTGNGTVMVWNTEAGRQSAVRGHTARVLGVAFSADSQLLFSKSADDTVRVWRCDRWEEVASFQEHSEFMAGLAVDLNGSRLATRDDRTYRIRVWQLDGSALLSAGRSVAPMPGSR